MEPIEPTQRRPLFALRLALATFVGVGGIIWIIFLNWFGVIYVVASALSLWQLFRAPHIRLWPRAEDVHPPNPNLIDDE